MKIKIIEKPKLVFSLETFHIPIEYNGVELTLIYTEDDNGAQLFIKEGEQNVTENYSELFEKLDSMIDWDWYAYCKFPEDFDINYGVEDFELDNL